MKKAILGTWELVAAEGRYDDGSVEHLYGPAPRGLLVYTPEGKMIVQVSTANRPRFASDDLWKGTSEELRAAFNGYVAYFGRYELNEAEGVVVHHVEGSMFPNWAGNVQRRRISLEGDRLVLSALPMPVGDRIVTATLTWDRSHRSTPDSMRRRARRLG